MWRSCWVLFCIVFLWKVIFHDLRHSLSSSSLSLSLPSSLLLFSLSVSFSSQVYFGFQKLKWDWSFCLWMNRYASWLTGGALVFPPGVYPLLCERESKPRQRLSDLWTRTSKHIDNWVFSNSSSSSSDHLPRAVVCMLMPHRDTPAWLTAILPCYWSCIPSVSSSCSRHILRTPDTKCFPWWW